MVGNQGMSGRSVAIGVGCRKGCSADAIESLVRHALGRTPTAIPLALFTLIDKCNEAGLVEAAKRLGFDLVYLSRETLRDRENGIQTRSPLAQSRFGIPSVAEAAALAGAGPASILIVPRVAKGGATCAIAGSLQ